MGLLFFVPLLLSVAAALGRSLTADELPDFNLEAQVAEWERLGHPAWLQFPDTEGSPAWGSITSAPEALIEDLARANYAEEVKFYLFTQKNHESGTVIAADEEAIRNAGWNADVPTKFIIHGFGNNVHSDMIQFIKNSLLESGEYNVVAVDWGSLAPKPFYITSRSHVKGVGAEVAKRIEFLIEKNLLKCEDVHVIGHSLGAHVAGNVGKKLNNCRLRRITGLDPAFPLFVLITGDRISDKDAEVVDVIHTCAGMLGFDKALGTVDHYPNGGGRPQPGCDIDLVGSCSHARSYFYFAESVMEKGVFGAVQCPSAEDALNQKCHGQDITSYMGLHLKYKDPGPYYLRTASSFPFDEAMHQEKKEGDEAQRKDTPQV